MKISAYDNFNVNSFQTFNAAANKWETTVKTTGGFWKTSSVTTTMPDGGNIGRVDHFRKKTIKQIVSACVKQVVQREGKAGKHIITIELTEDWDYTTETEIKPAARRTKILKVEVFA